MDEEVQPYKPKYKVAREKVRNIGDIHYHKRKQNKWKVK